MRSYYTFTILMRDHKVGLGLQIFYSDVRKYIIGQVDLETEERTVVRELHPSEIYMKLEINLNDKWIRNMIFHLNCFKLQPPLPPASPSILS